MKKPPETVDMRLRAALEALLPYVVPVGRPSRAAIQEARAVLAATADLKPHPKKPSVV